MTRLLVCFLCFFFVGLAFAVFVVLGFLLVVAAADDAAALRFLGFAFIVTKFLWYTAYYQSLSEPAVFAFSLSSDDTDDNKRQYRDGRSDPRLVPVVGQVQTRADCLKRNGRVDQKPRHKERPATRTRHVRPLQSYKVDRGPVPSFLPGLSALQRCDSPDNVLVGARLRRQRKQKQKQHGVDAQRNEQTEAEAFRYV